MKKIWLLTIFMMVCAVTQGVVAQDTLTFQGHRPWNWRNVELTQDVFRHIVENSSEVQTDEEFQQLVGSFPFRTEREYEPVFLALKANQADREIFGVEGVLLNVKADKAFIYVRVNDRWYKCVTDDPYYIGVYWAE